MQVWQLDFFDKCLEQIRLIVIDYLPLLPLKQYMATHQRLGKSSNFAACLKQQKWGFSRTEKSLYLVNTLLFDWLAKGWDFSSLLSFVIESFPNHLCFFKKLANIDKCKIWLTPCEKVLVVAFRYVIRRWDFRSNSSLWLGPVYI